MDEAQTLIPLSGRYGKGLFAIVDPDMYDELIQYRWFLINTYAARMEVIDGHNKNISMHRMVANTPKGMQTDHLNGIRLDNRRSNLRVTDHSGNQRNKKNVKGYYQRSDDGSWIVRAPAGNAIRHYGRYATEEEAKRAYQLACSGVKRPEKIKRLLPRGVYRKQLKNKVKYQAFMKKDGKNMYFGLFNTVAEANAIITAERAKLTGAGEGGGDE